MLIAASVAFANLACAAPASLLAASNPFAKPSTLPFAYPAFDQIKNDDYAPAFAEGMRQHAAEIEAIANNRAAPTFDNSDEHVPQLPRARCARRAAARAARLDWAVSGPPACPPYRWAPTT